MSAQRVLARSYNLNERIKAVGTRTGKEPEATSTFLWRICHALDEPPRMLAKNIGLPYEEIAPLLRSRHTVAEIDKDDTWWAINSYVDRKLGLLLAIKADLNRALQKDRAKRLMRIKDFERMRYNRSHAKK